MIVKVIKFGLCGCDNETNAALNTIHIHWSKSEDGMIGQYEERASW